MASIIEAVEDIFQDGSALVKFAVYAAPIFLNYHLYMTKNPLYWPLNILISIIMLGFTTECVSNARNGKEKVMPGYNIFKLFWHGIKALIAMLPYIIAFGAAAFFAFEYVLKNIITVNAAGITWIIITVLFTYGIATAAVMTAYFLYARRFRILDAYNLKTLSDAFGDVFVGLILFIIKMALLNVVIIGSVTYLFVLFTGMTNNYDVLQNLYLIFADLTKNNLYLYFLSMMAVFQAAITGDYYAQLSYEAIEVKENN